MMMAALLNQSCRLKKYIPSDEYLLGKVKLKDPPTAYSSDLYNLIKDKPNKKFVFIRLNMWAYLLSSRQKVLLKGEEKLRKEIWEEPVLLDSSSLDASAVQMESWLFNKGYFRNDVKYSTKKVLLKPKIRKVIFKFDVKERYTISKVGYNIADTQVRKIFFAHRDESLLSPGMKYDGDIMAAERERITQLLRNNGYYNFSREYIYFGVDTSLSGNNVSVGIGISNPPGRESHRIYKVNDIFVIPEYHLNDTQKKDTLVIEGLHFITKDPLVKPEILTNFVFYQKGKIFETIDYQSTINRLSQLGIYQFVDIQYQSDSLISPDTSFLNVFIRLSPSEKQEIQYDLELNSREESQLNLPTGTNRTLGIAVDFAYQHKNVAHRGLLFEFRPRLTFELPITVFQESRIVDTPNIEYGASAGLSFPQLIIPFKKLLFSEKSYDETMRLQAQTSLNLNFFKEHNKYYKRTTSNINLAWQVKKKQFNHFITPIEFSLVNTEFSSKSLKDTIEKSNDPLLLNLFDKHIIGDVRYSLLINQQPFTLVSKPFTFFRISAETGGHLLSVVDYLFDNKKDGFTHRGSGSLFGIRYYQYIRSEVDLRHYIPVGRYSNLALRALSGIGTPYGNATILPYEKRFFGGGANDIRAWQIRSLGPGSFNKESYFDHSGDFKLEGNAELRFPVYGIFKSAIFLDMGNVWTLNYDSTRTGSQFNVKTFYKEIAIGTGLGIRFDFSFIVLRLDLSVPMNDPAMPLGDRFVIRQFRENSWIRKNINVNIGVGYPF